MELSQLVAANDVQRQWPKIVARTKAGQGAVGVTENDEIIGVFVSAHEYELMRGKALRQLLRERLRSGEPTYTSNEVLDFAKKRLQRSRKKKA